MAEISISRRHGLNEKDARDRIEVLADKISGRLGGNWSWQGDQAVCEVHGVRAQVRCDAQSIWVDVKLPPMMKPLRGKLEAKIIEHLDRHFSKTSAE